MTFYEAIKKANCDILVKCEDYKGMECWEVENSRDFEGDSGIPDFILVISDNEVRFADEIEIEEIQINMDCNMD